MFSQYLVAFGAALWSLDTIFRSKLTGHYSAFFIVLVTHLLCCLIIFPILWRFRQKIIKLNLRDWMAFLFLAIAGNVLAMVAFTYAFSLTTNYSVPILIQKVQPFIGTFSAVFFLNEKMPRYYFPLTLLAFVGSYFVAFGAEVSFSINSQNHVVILFSMAAATFWGLGTTFGRYLSLRHSFWLVTSMRYGLGSLVMLALFPLWVNEFRQIQESLSSDLPQFFAMAFIPGLLALFIYYKGLQVTEASLACWLELSYPLAAIFVNWIFLGSTLNFVQIFGGSILVLSVLLLNLRKIKET